MPITFRLKFHGSSPLKEQRSLAIGRMWPVPRKVCRMCGQIDTREGEGGVRTKLCERCKDAGHTTRHCSKSCQKMIGHSISCTVESVTRQQQRPRSNKHARIPIGQILPARPLACSARVCPNRNCSRSSRLLSIARRINAWPGSSRLQRLGFPDHSFR